MSAGCMGVCVHLVLVTDVSSIFGWNFVTSMHDLSYVADVYTSIVICLRS